MESLEEVLQYNMWPIIAIVGVSIISIIITIVRTKKNNKRTGDYLTEHPNAAKVFIPAMVVSGLQVHTVDGEEPATFHKGGKTGFYVRSGEGVKLVASFTTTRPGVMHKTVSKTYGPITKSLNLAPKAEYKISFDKKAKDFLLTEK